MPITEAMASGAPVVASSHASMDEACGRRGRPRRSGEPAGDRRGHPRRARPPRRAARARARARAALLVAAHRRDLPGRVRAIRVALDTTPLRQTRAGTARYVRALRDHLRRRSRSRIPATSRLRTLVADTVWYPRLARASRRRRAALPDVPRAVSRTRRRSSSPCTTSPCCAIPSGSTAGRRRTRASPCRASFAPRRA